jgi:phosphoribosylformylglycinamidine cyclo-ligase
MQQKPEVDRYAQRGVSSGKEEVENAIINLYKGLYPTAFCKIVPDFEDDAYCNILHSDGVGTKSALAYLYWKETGDLSVWENLPQDAIAMNIDDMACAGATNNFYLSQIIDRDAHMVPGEVIAAIIRGTEKIIQRLQKEGINIIYAGGETADTGDVTRTISLNMSVSHRMKRENVIRNEIRPGSIIVGLASYGNAKNEEENNSGIMSNGLTAARHELFKNEYAKKYPETYSPFTDPKLIYCGKNSILPSLGKMLLSPTRLYVKFIDFILSSMRTSISGIIHCTGGGATKVLKKVENLNIIKDTMFSEPFLFHLIRISANSSYRYMYEKFNMGCGMEIYCDTIEIANSIIFLAKNGPGIEAQIIGHTEAYDGKKLSITTPDGEVLTYVG